VLGDQFIAALFALVGISGLSLILFGIAWVILKPRNNRAGEFSDASDFGDLPHLHGEMRTGGRNLLSKPGGSRLDRAGDRPSRTTLTHAFTRPSSGTEAL
jgi:hypothetical protein